MENTVLVIGAGGVGEVVVHKCAQNNDILGDICLASRTLEHCDEIIAGVHEENNLKDKSKKLYSKKLEIEDEEDVESVVEVIKEVNPNMVINVAIVFTAHTPWFTNTAAATAGTPAVYDMACDPTAL